MSLYNISSPNNYTFYLKDPILSTDDVKASILVSDGTEYKPLAPGSNGDSLVLDSGETLGVKWNPVGGMGSNIYSANGTLASARTINGAGQTIRWENMGTIVHSPSTATLTENKEIGTETATIAYSSFGAGSMAQTHGVGGADWLTVVYSSPNILSLILESQAITLNTDTTTINAENLNLSQTVQCTVTAPVIDLDADNLLINSAAPANSVCYGNGAGVKFLSPGANGTVLGISGGSLQWITPVAATKAYANTYLHFVSVNTNTPVVGTYYRLDMTGSSGGGSSDFIVNTLGSGNLLIYNGAATKTFKVSSVVIASANVVDCQFIWQMRKNDSIVVDAAQSRQSAVVGDFDSSSMEGLVSLDNSDYISVWVANATTTNPVTLHDISITIVEA